ncbi:MAG TPA: gluconate 2-dehydrogenase subunit 3 family protein [Gemmatimonadaceae bacterium]|nr:gluconate 2-dehydrogenase subunit 3 family protein [Gemmatimonadaceae bacterium]
MDDRPPPGNRYRGYDVLDRWTTVDWDDSTRAVIRNRCENIPEFRFFSAEQAQLLEAVIERIVPQPGAEAGVRVPIAQRIDEKLFHDWRDGYRYEGLPPQRDAWALGLSGIQETARELYGRGFTQLDGDSQDRVLQRVQHGEVSGHSWEQLPARLFFSELLCSTAVGMYYSHPKAWSEIGYSGPAAIRGHVRKWTDGVDPWEPRETHDPGTAEE